MKSVMEAVGEYHPQILRRPRRASVSALIADAYTPPGLAIDHVIAAEYELDDGRFSVRAMGWPPLVRPDAATAFLIRRCGGAIDGMSFNVREDGNINAVFTQPLLDPSIDAVVSREMVEWMLGSAVQAVGLIGGYIAFMNLCDAGLTDSAARKWVRRSYRRYRRYMLGDELRRARRSAGLTQEQLAAKARISREYVSQLERDRQSPTVDMLPRICRILDASAAQIIASIEKGSGSKRTGSPGVPAPSRINRAALRP